MRVRCRKALINTRLFEDLREIYRKERLELGEIKSAQLIESRRGSRRYATIGRMHSEWARASFSID